jgi:hypothetical protein
MLKRSIPLIALAATALLVSCARNADRPFVVASVSDVSSLDPHLLDVNHPTGSVIWSLFDSLATPGSRRRRSAAPRSELGAAR